MALVLRERETDATGRRRKDLDERRPEERKRFTAREDAIERVANCS